MSYPPHPGGYQPPAPQEHPRATMSLVLGILGVVVCGVLAPFAWRIGKQALNDIDASGGQITGRGMAQAGYILGIIGTAILGIALVVFVVATAIGLAGAGMVVDVPGLALD